jgi:hypothetical protein
MQSGQVVIGKQNRIGKGMDARARRPSSKLREFHRPAPLSFATSSVCRRYHGTCLPMPRLQPPCSAARTAESIPESTGQGCRARDLLRDDPASQAGPGQGAGR